MDPNQKDRHIEALKVVAEVEADLDALFAAHGFAKLTDEASAIQFSAYDERMLRCMKIKI